MIYEGDVSDVIYYDEFGENVIWYQLPKLSVFSHMHTRYFDGDGPSFLCNILFTQPRGFGLQY